MLPDSLSDSSSCAGLSDASGSSVPPASTPDTDCTSTFSTSDSETKSNLDTTMAQEESRLNIAEAQETASQTTRPRRARSSIATYNVAALTSAVSRKRQNLNDDRRRITISGPLSQQLPKTQPASNDPTSQNIDALDLPPLAAPRPRQRRSLEPAIAITRRSTRSSGPTEAPSLPKAPSRKRSRKSGDDTNPNAMSRELKRLKDTLEFDHVDTRPVLHTVWSCGKLVVPGKAPKNKKGSAATDKEENAPADERAADDAVEQQEEAVMPSKKRRVKKYLDAGLYAGQKAPADFRKSLSLAEKKKLAQNSSLNDLPPPNKVLPLPIFGGIRLFLNERDFKLPFDVCNPLPPGQPKPEEWKKITKNRFIGDSKDYWKKSSHFGDSKCVCLPSDGCGESCQNRTMLYECDSKNCNIGQEHCTNRAFADLQKRRANGNKYAIGVEVLKTSDRGYGVRSTRCFEPHQIIVEYTGEIITEEESDRRMNEVYKNNDCYYLMSFDQNMIIDATHGSSARFVNHSCRPNCRMVKWLVSGQPRMALFAGDEPIQTGDELTYDYNFDPFSSKNVQKCLCGEDNCRGFLAPRRDIKSARSSEPKEAAPPVKPVAAKAGKRKLKELLDDSSEQESVTKATKKRKVVAPAGNVKAVATKTSTKITEQTSKSAVSKVSTKVTTTTTTVKTSRSQRRKTDSALFSAVTTQSKSATKSQSSRGALGVKPTTTVSRRRKSYHHHHQASEDGDENSLGNHDHGVFGSGVFSADDGQEGEEGAADVEMPDVYAFQDPVPKRSSSPWTVLPLAEKLNRSTMKRRSALLKKYSYPGSSPRSGMELDRDVIR